MVFNYSVDMIRLLVRGVLVENFEKFINSIRKFDTHVDSDGVLMVDGFKYNIKYWTSNKFKSYRHNFTYSDFFGNSFYFAFQHNSEKKSNRYNLVLEYNPNKIACSDDLLREIKKLFFYDKTKIFVKSFDIAIDFIDVNILNCVLDTGMKKEKLIFDKGSDDRTIYCGKDSGRVKLYNKKKEREKKGECVPYNNLTRFETSFVIDCDVNLNSVCDYLSVINFKLYPIVSIYTSSLFDDSLTRCVVLGLIQEPSLLATFTRKYKEKYKKILSEFDSFQLNENIVKNCLNLYIDSF